MSASIRVGQPTDLDVMQRLNAMLFQYEEAHGFYASTYNLTWPFGPAGRSYFTRILDPSLPDSTGLIAVADNKVVGYLAGSLSRPSYRTVPVASIENMFVWETSRRTGAGSQLVDVFVSWAKEKGAKRLRTDVFADNEATHFYKAQGFEVHEQLLERDI